MSEAIDLRRATLADASAIVKHRRAMFHDMGHHDQGGLDLMAAKFRVWLEAKMQSEEYLAWLVITGDERVVAGAGLWLMDWPPHMQGSGQRRGNILNVYTEPEFRRRGLARRLVEAALDWCRENQIDLVILHASDAGRRLYESLGFQPGNEMRIKLQKSRQDLEE
ncbi:MAG TPA: GNAT family N-acetyltransferase [Terriglobales bacterium]|nr:GNAT family N-acetyltransferase [Terriglobales bacterium]